MNICQHGVFVSSIAPLCSLARDEVPFPRSYWVRPGILLEGCYPGAPVPREVTRKLKGLLDTGIRGLISLMEPDETDALLENNTPTYIHCWGGKGRTGTVVGCWLARHSIATGQEALASVQHLRRKDPTADQPSPENRIQCSMVLNWREGE